MFKLNSVLVIIAIVLCQAWNIHSKCSEIRGRNGTIFDNTQVYRRTYENCWKIAVPENRFVRITVQSLNFYSQSCANAYLRIKVSGTNETYTFCHSDDSNRNPVVSLSDVTINIYFREYNGYTRSVSFTSLYIIQDIECAREDSFRCTNFSCIPKTQVCDGVKNCENGADEIGCETGVISIPGVAEARTKAIAWLKRQRTSEWGWRENTARAVTALFLAEAASFNGTNLEEELMAKQTELKTAIALLKSPISNEQLSMFINALLVTCHNPRRFYGHDLVKQLKGQVESSKNFTHPIAYLALCNANESWPVRAIEDLSKIFNSDADYSFVKDIQAFAVMAISCSKNNTKLSNQTQNSKLTLLYKNSINRFKEHQFADGSFGNVHTTALVTQALISSGDETARDWKLKNTIKYLIGELNSSSVEFFSIYLTLPVLKGKSLADIVNVNCSANPRKHGGDLVSDINDYIGPKMRVQYSLFMGDKKDVVPTISLLVPENFTAYELMELVAAEDHKYKFEWKRVSGKAYVYRIGQVTNDPESGKFWLLYLGSTNTTAELKHSTSSPDEIILKEFDHLIMWYRRVEI